MRRYMFTFAVAVMLLVSTTTVRAISNGVIDTELEYRNVGVMAVEYAPGLYFHPCTGSLIAPQVFLVAAHCVVLVQQLGLSAGQVFVTFDLNFFTASTLVQASEYHFDPAFGRDLGDLHDLGVIILSQPVTKWDGEPLEPVQLPTAGLLDQMAELGGLRGESFINVGYGWDPSFKGAPRVSVESMGIAGSPPPRSKD